MPIGYTANLQIYVEIFRVGFNNTDQLLTRQAASRKDAKDTLRICMKIIFYLNLMYQDI
jgi:hypothetical protein